MIKNFDKNTFKGITLGYFTDTHCRSQNPVYRKDDFKSSIMAKFNDVHRILEQNHVDALLHGGDMFDTPNVSNSTWVYFASKFQEFGVPIYALAGNHDMEGHNVITLPSTPIYYMSKLGVIDLIVDNKDNPVIIKKNGVSVQITGKSFHGLMDKKFKEEDYVVTNKKADYAIHMVHGNLLDKPIIELAHYTLVEEVKHTLADLTLSGHYHMGFPLTTIEEDGMIKYFYNPGGFVRKTKKEMLRKPVFTLIYISEEGIHIEDIPLTSAKDTADILDIESIEKKKNQEEELTSLIEEIRSKSNITKKISLKDMLNDIGSQQNIEQPIKDKAMEFIMAAKEEMGGV